MNKIALLPDEIILDIISYLDPINLLIFVILIVNMKSYVKYFYKKISRRRKKMIEKL